MALRDSLISWWELNESSGSRVDAHGSNDLSDINTVLAATGKQGNGADFEATNSEALTISDASQSGLDITGDFSVSLWLNGETAGGNGVLFSKWLTTGDQRSYALFWWSSGNVLRTYISSDGTNANTSKISVSGALSGSTWYHVVFVYDASAGEVTLYIDGTATGVGATGHKTSIHSGSAQFALGDASGDFGYLDGILDEVAIWSRTLTSGEVSELYNSGAGLSYADTAGNTTVSPAAQVLTSSLPAPAVTGAASVAVAAQVLTASLPAETVIANWQVSPNAQVATFTIPAYTVVAGGIAVNPAAQALTFSLPTAAILGYATVNVNAQSLTFSVPTASITADWTVGVDPQVLTVTVPTLEFVGALWSRAARTTTGADWTRSAINNDA